jgi:two-component system phosphate regulon response regulator PhoB
MKHANVLVVEDDPGIQDMLKYSLSAEDYTLYQAYTVKEGWDIIDNSGIDLLHRIRKYHAMLPVIMVTAKAEEEDRILGLDVGADDYVTKPFSVRELNSRMQAILRRVMPDEQPLQIGNLFLDPVSHRAKVNETPLDLSPTEFRLLHYFMSHTDRVFSRSQLLDQVWGAQVYVEERTVDVHIRRLRKQLAAFDIDSLLQTVHGSGYRFSRQA